jgi:hypothetical protein
MTKILLIGSGGREHAIIDALEKSQSVEKVFIVPGIFYLLKQANSGMKRDFLSASPPLHSSFSLMKCFSFSFNQVTLSKLLLYRKWLVLGCQF